jgi:hypothetical protein|tara:strand:- start:253 stop:468 length:216 start_codon:yes stop_codon:yes gene_type:complete
VKKKLQSKQVGAEILAVECDCGGNCFGLQSLAANNLDREWYCEECDQEWELPDNIVPTVVFKKQIGANNCG